MPLLLLICAPVLHGAREARLSGGRADHTRVARRPTRSLLVLGAIVSLQCAAEGPVRAFFNVYLDRGLGVSPTQIGLMIGLAQVVPVVTAMLAVHLLNRWGAAATLAIASLGTSVAYLPLALAGYLGAAALGFTGVMTMASVHSPARAVLSQQLVTARWRTTTSAVLTMGTAAGWAVTAVVGGFTIATLGFEGLFLVSAALAGLAGALAWGTHRVYRGVTVDSAPKHRQGRSTALPVAPTSA